MSIACEVFISSKTTDFQGNPTKDSVLAREIHGYLTSKGHSVFLSTLSLEKLGIAAYKRAIDDALDSATVLIAVGTSRENLDSQWVQYEWDSFMNDILSDVKPEGRIFVYVDGVLPRDLPRALRQQQVFTHGPDSLQQLGNFVGNALGGAAPAVAREDAGAPGEGSAGQDRAVEVGVVVVEDSCLSALESAANCANSSQNVFSYVLLDDDLAAAIRLATYRDRAIYAPEFFSMIEEARTSLKSRHPFLLVVTDSAVSGKTMSNLFGSHRSRKGLALITTHQVADVIVPADRMDAYFLYYLARYTLSFLFPGLRAHEDTRSCVFDQKIRKVDLKQSMAARALCDKCRDALLAEGGLKAATKIDALDRLFALSGDILEK